VDCHERGGGVYTFLIIISFKKVMMLQLLLGRYVGFCLMAELRFNSFEQ